MSKPKLTLALSHYDRHIPFFDGSVQLKDFDLAVLQVGQSVPLKDGADRHGRMLRKGEFDALIMPHPPKEVSGGSDQIKRLFPNPKREELKYFQKNGFYPIMHILAFKDEILEKYPEAAMDMMEAFESAKRICREYYADPNWSLMAWGRHLFEEERRLLGTDPWPNGFKKNRANLTRFIDYAGDQGLLERALSPEELFFEPTLNT
ncbi:MAG: hypothetical protein P1P89_05530 [Desulfobacterales bacterium]|nr:hypothetical protein [Desulfobacterales bacterium]